MPLCPLSSLLIHPAWGPRGGEGCPLSGQQDPSTAARWLGDKGAEKGLFLGGKCPPRTPSLMSKEPLAAEARQQVTGGGVLRAGGAACALGMGQREGRAQAACGHPLLCPPLAAGWVGGAHGWGSHGAFTFSSRASWSSTSAGSCPARGRWPCRSVMPSWRASPSSCTGSASLTSARR